MDSCVSDYIKWGKDIPLRWIWIDIDPYLFFFIVSWITALIVSFVQQGVSL